MIPHDEKEINEAAEEKYVQSQYNIFFQNLSTNGLILCFSVYKLPKGPPTFIACLVNVCDVVHSPITFWTRGGKKNSKRSILVVSDDTYTHTMHSIHVYNILYKRSITFQVCSFYCAGDFFFALCKMLYDIKYYIAYIYV